MAITFSKYQTENFLDLSFENLRKNNEFFESEEDLEALSSFLVTHPEISFLKITGTKLGDKLAEFLKDANLSRVVLSNNKITSKGVVILTNNPNIKDFNLTSNYISPKDADLFSTDHISISPHPDYQNMKGFFDKPTPLKGAGFTLNEELENNGQKYIERLIEMINGPFGTQIFSPQTGGYIQKVLKDDDTAPSKFMRILEGMENNFKTGKLKPSSEAEKLKISNDHALLAALSEIDLDQRSRLFDIIYDTYKKATQGVTPKTEISMDFAAEATKITNPKR